MKSFRRTTDTKLIAHTLFAALAFTCGHSPAAGAPPAEVAGADLHVAWRQRAGDGGGERYLLVVNQSLTEPRTLTVKAHDARRTVREITTGQPEERASLTLAPGGTTATPRRRWRNWSRIATSPPSTSAVPPACPCPRR